MSETVGFIGLGVMGRPMAKNLLRAGFRLVVHSRSAPPVEDLVGMGATRAASPADVAARATSIITMLPDSPDVEAVLEGPGGVFERIQRGSVLIDCSTIAPATARRLATVASSIHGATMLDAPVSGGEIGAIDGTLSIMVGGDESAYTRVKPILDAMGNPERVVRIGDSGAGQLCKVCNQMVIGGALGAVSEAFALARKAGVDPVRVRQALLGGFASSRVLEVHGQRIIDRNYVPGFRTSLYAKDLRIASATLAEHETPAPVSAAVQQMVNAALAAGRGQDDYAVVGAVLAALAGLED